MNFEDIKNVAGILLEYLPNTLKLFAWTLVLSIPVGVIVTWLKKCRFKPISWLTNLYILIMRGTPLMLQIIAVYYAIPMLMAGARKSGADNWFYTLLGKINTRDENYMFIALVVAFVLNYAAYFAEIFRSGIQAIPAGQSEAATVLGYTRAQTFVRIILPQMTRIVLPPVTNEVITLVKDTSLAFALAYTEMFTLAKQIAAASASIMPLFIAGAFYYIFNFIVAWIMEYIEKKMRY